MKSIQVQQTVSASTLPENSATKTHQARNALIAELMEVNARKRLRQNPEQVELNGPRLQTPTPAG
jgi:hypothetical protein